MARKLNWKRVYQGDMPGKTDIKHMIGGRLLSRTKTPIVNDSELPEGFVDYPKLAADHDSATLVSSKMANGLHMPVIDVDRECMLVPSGTPGHFHLYINVPMREDEYMELLEVMAKVGIVQHGYALYSRQRGAGFVRYPGVTKANEQAKIDYWEGTDSEVETF